MTPREAARQLVRNNVDYLPIDEIEGRIATTLFVVYPAGIATIVPGERLDARARPMIEYLKAFERASNLFPGFEAEIQGLYREVDETGIIRFYTYVVRMRSAAQPCQGKPSIAVRIRPEVARLDAWIASQPASKPTRRKQFAVSWERRATLRRASRSPRQAVPTTLIASFD